MSEALDNLSELDQRVLRLLLITVGFVIIFGIGSGRGSSKSRLLSSGGPPPGTSGSLGASPLLVRV